MGAPWRGIRPPLPDSLSVHKAYHSSPWPWRGNRVGELIPFHFGVNQGLGKGRDLPEITQHPR